MFQRECTLCLLGSRAANHRWAVELLIDRGRPHVMGFGSDVVKTDDYRRTAVLDLEGVVVRADPVMVSPSRLNASVGVEVGSRLHAGRSSVNYVGTGKPS